MRHRDAPIPAAKDWITEISDDTTPFSHMRNAAVLIEFYACSACAGREKGRTIRFSYSPRNAEKPLAVLIGNTENVQRKEGARCDGTCRTGDGAVRADPLSSSDTQAVQCSVRARARMTSACACGPAPGAKAFWANEAPTDVVRHLGDGDRTSSTRPYRRGRVITAREPSPDFGVEVSEPALPAVSELPRTGRGILVLRVDCDVESLKPVLPEPPRTESLDREVELPDPMVLGSAVAAAAPNIPAPVSAAAKAKAFQVAVRVMLCSLSSGPVISRMCPDSGGEVMSRWDEN